MRLSFCRISRDTLRGRSAESTTPRTKTQVGRHELLGIVQDEHPPHIELHAAPHIAVPDIEGRPSGNEQERGVLEIAFHPAVHVCERVLEIVRGVLVELVVLVVLDLVLGTGPQRGRGVGRLEPGVVAGLRHEDGNGDVVGVATHDVSKPVALEELVLTFAQAESHLGAAGGKGHAFHRVLAVAGGFPAHPALHRHAGPTRVNGDLVRDDEAGVEAHSELPDELQILGTVPGERLKEVPGAGLGDGPQVLDDLLVAHADAVVPHGDGPCLVVVLDMDPEIAVTFVEVIVRQRLEAQLVRGVGSVRDEFPQEDLLVAVERVDHEVEQLLDLRLESQCLPVSVRAHDSSTWRRSGPGRVLRSTSQHVGGRFRFKPCPGRGYT